MFRLLVAIIVCSAALSRTMVAQGNQSSPLPSASIPMPPAPPNLPPGIGPQSPPNAGAPNPAAAGPPMSLMPNDPSRAGARPMPPTPPPINSAVDQNAAAPVRQQPASSASASTALISFLDSTAPFVQAFDLVLMLIAGVFCLRARKAPGLTILAIACFVSVVILLGFFLFGIFHGRGVFPQAAYIVARVLAPFELLLFVIGIIIVARRSRG